MAVYLMGRKSKGAPLRGLRRSSPDELHAWEAAKRVQEQKERHRTETVKLQVETHVACGGQIEYTSYFRDTAPRSQLVGSGHRPHLTEFVTCACAKCGSAITHRDHLARYAELMTAHRNRTTD